jgi:hypothetical protein
MNQVSKISSQLRCAARVLLNQSEVGSNLDEVMQFPTINVLSGVFNRI